MCNSGEIQVERCVPIAWSTGPCTRGRSSAPGPVIPPLTRLRGCTHQPWPGHLQAAAGPVSSGGNNRLPHGDGGDEQYTFVKKVQKLKPIIPTVPS